MKRPILVGIIILTIMDCSFFNVTNLKGGWGYAVAAQIRNANYNYS